MKCKNPPDVSRNSRLGRRGKSGRRHHHPPAPRKRAQDRIKRGPFQLPQSVVHQLPCRELHTQLALSLYLIFSRHLEDTPSVEKIRDKIPTLKWSNLTNFLQSINGALGAFVRGCRPSLVRRSRYSNSATSSPIRPAQPLPAVVTTSCPATAATAA